MCVAQLGNNKISLPSFAQTLLIFVTTMTKSSKNEIVCE